MILQLPAGFLSIVDLPAAPATWQVRRVELTGFADVVPEDPEPEFVSINNRNQVVVTLQENNHIVVVDLTSGNVVTDFTAGTGTASDVDTVEDGTIRLDGTVTVRREPDGVAWLDDRFVATADEGDLAGGSRTRTVFDTRDGSVVYSSGTQLDQLAARYGRRPELVQAVPTGVGPEGLLPLPQRDALVVAAEADSAGDNVRSGDSRCSPAR